METDINDQQSQVVLNAISPQGRFIRVAKKIILFLGVFVCIYITIWSSSFLFGTKNKKKITNKSVVSVVSATPIPVPTSTYIPLPTDLPTPTFSPKNLNPTLSPLINWKWYQYDKCEDNVNWRLPFTFKIPADWAESIRYASNGAATSSYTYSSPNLKFEVVCGDGFGGGGCGLSNTLIQDKFVANSRVISGCFEKDKTSGKLLLWLTYLHPITKKGPGLSLTGEGEDTPENRLLINQIISSFKLTGQE